MLLFQKIHAVEEIIKKEEAKGSRISELRDELARLPTSGEIQSVASDKISHSRVC